MQPKICPVCKSANKGTATTCNNCGTEFKSCPECQSANILHATTCMNCGLEFDSSSIPNCYYHPDRKSETTCPLCQRYICSEDTQTFVREYQSTDTCDELFTGLCCGCLFGIWGGGIEKKALHRKETIHCCPECYNNQPSDLQGAIVKDR